MMTTIVTRLGKVTGRDDGAIRSFLGVRYAEPPTGSGRFLPPIPVRPWQGAYDATEFPNRAMQPQTLGTLGQKVAGKLDEDCLFLNVVTPSVQGDRRPVMLWIHGGGYTAGSANEYDGTVLAKQGDVVVVTINYRLGLFGFLNLASLGKEFAGSASNGLRDQILSLEWVRDNIADYGGDPGNVTVFGESAGGGCILGLLAAPAADGLYHKAIVHSPPTPGAVLNDPTPLLASRLETDRSELANRLRAMTAQDLQALGIGGTACIDGTVVTRPTCDAIRDRGAAGVPIIAGTNRDEGTLFTAASREAAEKNPDMFEQTNKMFARGVIDGEGAATYLDALKAAYPGEDSRQIHERLYVDMFRRSSIRATENATDAGPGGWLYRFDLPATVGSEFLQATHASEMAFTFNSFANPDSHAFAFHDRNDPTVRKLAEQWSDSLVAFARSGDPNGAGLPEWPRYSATDRRCMVLNEMPRIENDPDEKHRKLWGDD